MGGLPEPGLFRDDGTRCNGPSGQRRSRRFGRGLTTRPAIGIAILCGDLLLLWLVNLWPGLNQNSLRWHIPFAAISSLVAVFIAAGFLRVAWVYFIFGTVVALPVVNGGLWAIFGRIDDDSDAFVITATVGALIIGVGFVCRMVAGIRIDYDRRRRGAGDLK